MQRRSLLAFALSAAVSVLASQTPFQLPRPEIALQDEPMHVLTHPALPAYSIRMHRVPDDVCERTPNVASWSGYLDVDLDLLYEQERKSGHAYALEAPQGVVEHFYFWAFESRNDKEKDPLTLWLNGGPGCSSFTGLLMELGPCNAAPAKDGVPQTEMNPYSWSTNSSMIFLDQPIGVGFTYASWKNSSREDAPPSRIFNALESSRDVSAFLHLLASQPGGPFAHRRDKDGQVQLRDFHMAGESYAGRYLPLIASRVVNDNEHYKLHPEEGLIPLPLKSVLIGNGITSPKHQTKAYVEFACTKEGGGPFLPEKTCDAMWKKLPACQKLVEKCNEHRGNVPYSVIACQSAATFCEGALSTPWEETNSSYYDWDHPVEYKQSDYVHAFLNDKSTRRHLGIDKFLIGDKHDGRFNDCSDQVYNDFATTGDGARDSTWAVEHVLDAGVRVLSYSGRRDFICNFIGNSHWIHDLEWSGSEGYKNAPLEDWFIPGQKKRAGQFRNYGRMTFAIVENAGHFVPLDQPEAALAMFQRWIHGQNPGRLDSL